MKLDNLKTFDQLVESNPEVFSVNKLKWLARNRDRNGLDKAFILIAGKFHVDVPALEKGIAERNAA